VEDWNASRLSLSGYVNTLAASSQVENGVPRGNNANDDDAA
jgi:hypothetical protein